MLTLVPAKMMHLHDCKYDLDSRFCYRVSSVTKRPKKSPSNCIFAGTRVSLALSHNLNNTKTESIIKQGFSVEVFYVLKLCADSYTRVEKSELKD